MLKTLKAVPVGFRWFLLFVVSLACAAAALSGSQNQERATGPWMLWDHDGMALIKYQDGDCSVYVAVGSSGYAGQRNVAVTTGQGCR